MGVAPPHADEQVPDQLRIGMIAPPWVPVPPPAYGGTELMIDGLCTGLSAAGHDVTLFTIADSTCPVRRRSLFEHPDPDGMGNTITEIRHAAAAYDEFADADIIHDHTLAGLFLSEHAPERAVVTTIHGPFNEDLADIYDRIDERIPIVAISRDQALRAPAGLEIARVIHHGIDLAKYRFSPTCSGDHVLFLGRMSPDKGIDTAITAARNTGIPLKIAAKMREPLEFRYFNERIRPLLGSEAEYVGEVGFTDKVELLTTARALLNPIQWPEPFGLVMIESLACGTPVVGYDNGAAPEIVDEAVTGSLASDLAGLERGLLSIDTYDRQQCRNVAVKRFSITRMVDEYVDVYRQTVSQTAGRDALTPSEKAGR